MAVSAAVSAVSKVAGSRRSVWPDGPLCSPYEIKAWSMSLRDFLELVWTIEGKFPTPNDAVQRIRRLYYSTPVGRAGPKFDLALKAQQEHPAQPITTSEVRPAVLDMMVRTGTVTVPGPEGPLNSVDLSHVFVLLDLALNKPGPVASLLRAGFGALVSNPQDPFSLDSPHHAPLDHVSGGLGPLAPVFSWAGDIASAWLGYNKDRRKAKDDAKQSGTAWIEDPGDLSMPLKLLDNGIRDRSPIEDLLGDMDAVVLAAEKLPESTTPVSDLLAGYYQAYQPETPARPSGARVVDRFTSFVRIVLGDAALQANGTLSEDAKMALTDAIEEATAILITVAYSKSSLEEMDSAWGKAMLAELKTKFIRFVEDGLAGRSLEWWPAGMPDRVDYPGYNWTPSAAGRNADLNDLEAIAQFFLDWRVPQLPLRDDDRTIRFQDSALRLSARLLDPGGSSAVASPGPTAGTSRLTVDSFVDLNGIDPSPTTGDHRDLVVLSRPDRSEKLTYRIIAVDPAAAVITIKGIPPAAEKYAWRAQRRPRVVIVDPWRGRATGRYTLDGETGNNVVELESTTDAILNAINSNFDVIRLSVDANPNRPSGCYRIVKVDSAKPLVVLEVDAAILSEGEWQIPAGIEVTPPTEAGAQPAPDLLRPSDTGCDHYDGLAFVVHANTVQDSPIPFTSYASAIPFKGNESRVSVNGNRVFRLRSFLSDAAVRNFSFQVHVGNAADRIGDPDVITDAAKHFEGVTANRKPTNAVESAPKAVTEEIRIHAGHPSLTEVPPAGNTGSAGCIVSREYEKLRATLIDIHLQEVEDLGETMDAALSRDLESISAATTAADSQELWNANANGTKIQWHGHLAATLVLIRPDERRTG
jgi:hypothetical protein